MLSRRERIKYIDGMKGMACCLIMLGHISGVIKYAMNVSDSVKSVFIKYPGRLFFDEGFWLVSFYVISGYLISRTCKRGTIRKGIVKLLLRLLRFLLLIFTVDLIIYIIQCFPGFYNGILGNKLNNTWLSGVYSKNLEISAILIDPIRTMLLGNSKFNPPFYVLRDMYIAACFVVILRFGFSKGKKAGMFMSVSALCACVVLREMVIFSHVFGLIADVLAEAMKEYGRFGRLKSILCKTSMSDFIIILFLVLTSQINFAYFTAVCFGIVIVLMEYSRGGRGLCETHGLLLISRLSFGIYGLHWAVICSVGSFVYYCMGMFDIWVRWSVLAITVIFVTILLAIGYHYIFEIKIDILMEKIKRRIYEKEFSN